MNREKLYIIMPAYNEEENIQKVICDWHLIVKNVGEESRLVVIDDGSKDDTYFIVQKLQEEHPQLVVLTKKNSGHGPTCTFGYKYAIENEADYIFQTDSDGQTVSEEFWNFWQQRRNFDMVIGWRKNRKDGLSRIVVTKILKLVIRICFKVNVTDANTPFRLMKTETLKKYISIIPEGYNLSNVLISVIYAKKGLRVRYIPVTFKARQGGVNSINLKKIVKIGEKAIKDFMYLNKEIENADNK